MKSPQRGEVWLVDLGMAAKIRPAVAISVPADDSDRALVTLVPHTTSPRSSRFEVAVGVAFLHAGGFDAQNLVTIPHAKLIRVLGRLSGVQLGGGRAGRMHVARNPDNEVRGLTWHAAAGAMEACAAADASRYTDKKTKTSDHFSSGQLRGLDLVETSGRFDQQATGARILRNG